MSTNALRNRCKSMYQQMMRNAILRQHDPVEDLMAFVIAEIGRSADERLDNTAPLCLYFTNDKDREEFIELWKSTKPKIITKKLP